MANDVTGGEPDTVASAVIVRSGKIALVARGSERWRAQPGYILVPLELPGGPWRDGETPEQAITRVCREALGVAARPLSSRQLYGPSARRRMDKLSAASEVFPLPLLRFERAVLRDDPAGERIVSTVTCAYLTRLDGEPSHSTMKLTCGVLWSPPEALGALLRGVPFAETANLPHGVEWQANPDRPLPDDAFFFVPSEFGERQLARLIAKYGRSVLDGEERTGES
jgi:ADP-ribose pyrophosphatase YjhB (NUDIX family)